MGKNYNSDGDSDEGSRSRSQTPLAAPTPGFSLEHHDPQSRSGSPNSQRSGSPNSQRSGRSKSGSGSGGSRSRSGSRSRPGSRSQSGSRHSGSQRSRSGSAASNRSGSGSRHSPDGNRSRSGSQHSPVVERRSRSGSRKSGRSRSGSAASKHSGSGSDRSRSGSRRSRSGSRQSRRSKSGSHRSRSGSAASHKSGSRTPSGSRKNSPSRSRSASPKSGEKRKRGIISDSGSEGEATKAPVLKKLGIIDSDSEPEKEGEEPKEGVTADAIFGDDVSDISTEDEGEKKDGEDTRRSKTPERARSRSRSRSKSNDQDFERIYQQLSDEEKPPEAEPEPIPETRIDVEIPRIVSNLGRDIHFVKMPNFLSVETRPFDVETYEDEIDEEDVMDEEGRQRLKLKVGNTIRWREEYNADGSIRHESNARIVKWSDGSMSLHLGSEIFDVYKQPLTGDHNHLFIRQGTGLQGQAVFRSKLTFRPHSTDSFTHKKMTISLADRSQKTSGIKILTQVGYDPDADRYQKLKSEEEKLRQAMRARAGVVTKQPKRSSAAANASYHDEGSDDEGAISIAAIKGKYKKDKNQKQSASAIYSSDEDGSDIDSRRKKKIGRSKALRALDDEDGGSSDEGSASGSGSASGNDDKQNSDNTADGNESD